MSEYLQAFLNGDPLPLPKKRLVPNFLVKPRNLGENSVKRERDPSESFNYAEKLRAQEENEILTKILNRPADQTLGINEQHEKAEIPPANDVFLKYEFDLDPVKLPIREKRQEILEQLERNEVIIIRATTGSGKSSQVPQYILEEAHRRKKNVNIIVTQPRRISAQSLANRVALERKCEVGSLVGYQIGLDRKVSNTDTRLLYCTTGVFLQKLVNEKSTAKWTHCIIDEIHERDMDMDFVLLILRRLLSAKHTGTKLILMSATMETESISKYFMNHFSPQSEFKPAILDLKVPRPHPVRVDYLDAFKQYDYFGVLKEFIDIKNPAIEHAMYSAGVEILKLLADKGMKSFLVFLPGWYEIENFYHALLKLNHILDHFTVIKLHSTMGMDDIKELYNQNIEKKIIISTNIAESSITIPDIDFIIDYCLMKHMETETSSNLTQLKMVWASKVNLRQREGRVGRTKHGQVVRMIFEEHFEKMPDEAPAEMQRTSLETVILKAKRLKMGKPIDILGLALSPPPRNAIVDAILVLKELGALTRHTEKGFDFEDGDITFVGEIMSNVPVDVRLSKLIVLGYMFNVLKEMIIIAAGLSVRSIFKQSSVKQMDTFEAKFTFGSGSSDVLAILNVYKTWIKFMEEKHNKLEQKNFELNNKLDVRNLRDMKAHIHDIMKRLEQLGFSKNSLMENRVEKYSERMFLIKICIAGAFYPNFYIFGGDIPDRDTFNTLNYKNPCHSIYYKNFQNNHCGDLYKNEIIQHLLNNEIIKSADDAEIHFDTNSTRVVVEFKNLRNDEDVKVPGDVKFEVYKALRFARHHGKYNLKLELLSVAQENDYLQKKRYKNRANESSKTKKDDGQCIYPKARASVNGYITSIISPGKFYIQPEAGRERLQKFKSKVFLPSALMPIRDLRECVRENLIIVRNMKNEFYRAQIIETPYQNKPFKVRLIDFGNNVRCEFEDFYTFIGSTTKKRQELLKEVFRYPPLCFEAKLAECKPAVIYQTGWSSNATDKFKEIIDGEARAGRKIDIKVYAFNNYDKVVSVYLNLKETSNRHGTSVNQMMSLYGYTQIANESYIYQISRVTDEIKVNAKNEHFDFKDYSDAPRGFDKLTLTGPISTFSHNTFERTTHCHESEISIDPWSVNSILIDPYPFDGIRKVMVAACRSKNDKGKITLRHTTVLPHVTGMACLLALIFCPTAQFRYDKNFHRFTSILTGLGCSFDGKSYYKEHDCLFHTDVDLDAEDISSINELREIMSELMEKFQLSNENYREELAVRAQDKLFEIMQRNRAQVGATLRDGYNWNGENALKEDRSEKMKMFPSLTPRSLQPYSYERWKTLKNLNEEFEEKADSNARDESIDCVLCEERVETIYELKTHVLKSKHANLVINLEKSRPEQPAIGIKREHRYTVDSECGGPSQRIAKKEKYN